MSIELEAAEPIPDLVQAVIGFRQWRLHEGRLYSLHTTDPWVDGRLEASCRRSRRSESEPHFAPDPSCSCGVHAYHRPVPRTAATGWTGVVNGAVALWGAVQVHAKGLRAEHAQVVALARPVLSGRKRRDLECLAEELDVGLVPGGRLAAEAFAHGSPVPGELRPTVQVVGVVTRFD